ncbi:formamidopyrimidine-DNA glycosylase [Spiroplasma clarkii]|uniref:Formamidopyrimidine-DNA glycosylase n=1 Tax=Spiroplasma clarkii TaxID=2139 RepID=A0A1Y0L0F0_9MOLU|nr:DNA-formamidopyrimidine glycosylase [Spiroplasma clarkii]ARU91188.1 formamidopyrimidine-DNA glycosylase [Spiroplasma clarkii]ATX70627.1 formamidopyrimidine-DNA glycosylase [Spiroplasma clarkii]
MPELPEVETVVRILRTKILGEQILDVKVYLNKFIKGNIDIPEFRKDIVGRTIAGIERIGKNIIFELQDKVLISHLRMTGKWFVFNKANFFESPHHLAVFTLSHDKILAFHDVRKFGTFHYQDQETYKTIDPINKVALEPLDSKVNGEYLQAKMQKSARHIKTLLLDQTLVAGIGNIYADEILFASKINPLKLGNQLDLSEYTQIAQNATLILKKAIEYGGTTINSYQSEQGVDGRFQRELQVHTRAGQNCYLCGSKIVKIKVNGRGTYYCPKCQF